ncbi:hypothetical protein PMI09_03791 [Rhizobium sp. CF122]|nr:hypothetical protein PMI09_03791 [Rhizobium sp. CF122]
MPKDYFDFHPFRFQLLTAAIDVRQALHRSDSTGGQSPDAAATLPGMDFAGMSETEFHRRLDLMTEMRDAWRRWSIAGAEILDFSEDMAELAGSKIVELPWYSSLTDVDPVYVHFGAEAGLALSGRNRVIEGVYLETAGDPRIALVRFVCSDVSRGGSLGDALVAQSEVISARLDRSGGDFIDFDGDPSLVSESPTSAMVSRTLFAHPMVTHQMRDSVPLGCGRHHFFPKRSFKAALSSIASARSRFSFVFSSSSVLSRLASDTSMPPNLAFHL